MNKKDIIELEQCLWRSETRFDPAVMEALFSPDFLEFGRSGRRYSRSDTIFQKSQAVTMNAKLHNIDVRELTEDVAQVTYISEVHYAHETEWANRSSIWTNTTGAWQLRFHQGTPTDARQ